MRVTNIIYEDIVNYKETTMFISTAMCDGKCWKDIGADSSMCQNSKLSASDIIEIDDRVIINKYMNNNITHGIVFGGLEPFMQYEELFEFITSLRFIYGCNDPVIIYTGYTVEEIEEKCNNLASTFSNIIVKFGRYVPGEPSHFDDVLGVNLASYNQFAIDISKLLPIA